MVNEISKVKDEDRYILQLPEGTQKRGRSRRLTMDSKFPEGYFEWLDKRIKYDHKGGSVLDYMAVCDIQGIHKEAEKQTAYLKGIDRKLGDILEKLEDLDFVQEEVSEDEELV